MAILVRSISYTSVTTHREITFSADLFGPILLMCSMALGDELRRDLGINLFRFQGSMVSGTELCWGSGSQWKWVRFRQRYRNATQ